MRAYRVPLIILALQLAIFYLFPLTAGPTDAMGMVFLILCSTLLSGAAIGGLTDGWRRLMYPPLIAALFIPSVFIYYNASALVHALWYLVTSSVGLALGALPRAVIKIITRK